jgi:hypothetical protein
VEFEAIFDEIAARQVVRVRLGLIVSVSQTEGISMNCHLACDEWVLEIEELSFSACMMNVGCGIKPV